MNMFYLAGFIGAWVGFAFYAKKQNWSNTIAAGGGLILGLFSLGITNVIFKDEIKPELQPVAKEVVAQVPAEPKVEDFVVVVSAETGDLNTEKYDNTKAKAMRGDYQAQRNLAFGYSSMPYVGQDKNPILACAWRIVIVKSGNEHVDSTDVGNYNVYCNIDDTSKVAAEAQASVLLDKIYNSN